LIGIVALTGCGWPQFRHGPERSGFTQKSVAEFAGIHGLASKWSAATGDAVASSPVVAGGIAYVGSDDGSIHAYDATTGAPRWNRSTGGPIVAAPALDGGALIVGSADHTLRAFDAKDGTPKWTRALASNFGGAGAAPAAAGGRVYVSSADRVYALQRADGSDVWSTPSGLTGPLSPPAVAGDLVYVTSYASGTVRALHAADGTLAWSTTAPGTRSSCPNAVPTPAVVSGVVYAVICPAASPAASLMALDAGTGAIAWSLGAAAYTTSPAVANGRVYAGSAPNKDLEARRASDGALLWAGAIGSAVYSSPAVAASIVLVGADNGSLYAFDAAGQNKCGGSPRTCQPMWSDATGGAVRSSVAVEDSFFYVGSNDGSLHAYGLPPIAFSKSRLQNATISQPTVARFGPDGRLYVAQYNGQIRALTISRTGTDAYQVTNNELISNIRTIPNHDDDGTLNTSVTTRLITGLAVGGTASSPVLYVASSDPRVGGGSQGTLTNLDTNSGVISRLTRSGSTWAKTDIVRGLPRSEENHATNALVLDSTANVLFAGQGGHTNMGAPSHNFNFLPEYAYSAAILRIDLAAIGNSTYDLPTLVDESHPGLVGPFGGDQGKHQAKITSGSPVQVYAPGFRNAFALVRMQAGTLVAVDNGPNAGWGDVPLGEGTNGTCTNAIQEPGVHEDDSLHVLKPGYYGGHPNPTRANRGNTFNVTNPQSPVPTANPVECDDRDPTTNGAIAILPSGTTGMAEYTATNLANQLNGDLLVGTVDGVVHRVTMNNSGTKALATEPLFSNLGGYAIDVAVQGDSGAFPGTIWVPNLKLNVIDVFEPSDYGGRSAPPCTGSDNAALDEDQDSYANSDEIANGTDPCSSADVPHDWDSDFVSDLLDSDDDNDGTPDTSDRFAVDANNGLATNVPIAYPFLSNTAGSPCAPTPVRSGCPGGIIGLGFTGLMSNGSTDYAAAFDPTQMTVGGAAGVLTVDAIPAGDALGAANNQQYAFQYGVRVPSSVFTVHTQVLAPFAGTTPQGSESMGVFVGRGDQDNYVKLVLSAHNGAPQLQLVTERTGVPSTQAVPFSVADLSALDLYLTVDKTAGTITARYRATTGSGGTVPLTNVATASNISASWFDNTTQGLAIGLIATSAGGAPFPVTWSGMDATTGAP
jgi:outer membrane protein assembly factor BamB